MRQAEANVYLLGLAGYVGPSTLSRQPSPGPISGLPSAVQAGSFEPIIQRAFGCFSKVAFKASLAAQP
jgi:hypothetical protein